MSVLRSAIPWLAWLGLALAPGVGAVTVEEQAAQFYEDALVRFDEGDMAGAALQVKNVLQIMPAHRSGHILLARIHLREGDAAAAEHELVAARQAGADLSLIAPALGQAYLAQGKYEAVLHQLLPKRLPRDVAYEVLNLQGVAHQKLSQFDRALASYDAADALRPGTARPDIGRAHVFLVQRDPARALEYAERALAIEPDNTDAWYVVGSAHHRRGEADPALSAYARVLASEPEHLEVLLARAGLNMDRNDDEAARADLATVRTEFPLEPRAAYLQALLFARGADLHAAKSALAEAAGLMAKLPEALVQSDPSLQLLGALANLGMQDYEQSARFFEDYLEARPDDIGARRLLGSAQLSQGSYADAIDSLEPILVRYPQDAGVFAMIGTAYARKGEHAPAIDHFERALAIAANARTRLALAISRAALGQRERAIDDLMPAVETTPHDPQVLTYLATWLIQSKRAAEAVTLLTPAVVTSPDNVDLRNLLGAAQTRRGQLNEAEATFTAILAEHPNELRAAVNLGKIEQIRGQPARARQRYQDLLSAHPDNHNTMIELARLEEDTGRFDAAVRWLEKALTVQSEHVGATVRLIEVHLRAGQPERALEVARSAEQWAPNHPNILTGLSRAYIAVGKTQLALGMLKRLVGLAGYDTERLLALAEELRRANAWDDVAWTLSKAVKGTPTHLRARAQLAAAEIRLGRLDQAVENTERLVRQAPGSPAGYGLRGEIAMARGDHAEAAAAFAQALERRASDLAAVRFYEASANADQARADAWAVEWLQRHPHHRAVRNALAHRYAQRGDYARAKTHYQVLVELSPKHPDTLNKLGLVLDALDDPSGLALVEEARAARPDDPRINDNLGWMLVRRGEAKRGLIYLRSAHSRASNRPEIRYHIAVALNQLGRQREARRELEVALAADYAFAGIEEARKLLAQLAP